MAENGVMDQGTVVLQTGKIKLTLQIPASLQNQDSKKERAYFILCNKSGNVEVLSTGYDAKAKTITFEMEDYADYAVVYQDTDKSDNNNGNNNQNNTQNTNGNGSQKSGITKAAGTSATAAGSTVKAVNTADSTNVVGNIIAFLGAWMILFGIWIRRKIIK